MRKPLGYLLAPALLALAMSPAAAEENYASWEPMQSTFPSTGGNGIIIGEYDPVIIGDRCVTNFTATEPNGTVHRNIVEFDAIAVQGGTLCTNGRWRAADGSGSGTTPFRVFFKDGVRLRSP